MEALKGVFAVLFSCVLVGGIYIGSALLGYFLAVLGAALAVVAVIGGVLCFVSYCIYELFGYIRER